MLFVDVVHCLVLVYPVYYFCLCLFMRKAASACSDASSLQNQIQNCVDFRVVLSEIWNKVVPVKQNQNVKIFFVL